MEIQFNSEEIVDNGNLGNGIMITPCISEDYWIARVPLSNKQAIVAFPKFGIIGIGFQYENDWNCNLPSSCETSEIFNHISHNKGDESISDEDCLSAIDAIKEVVNK